MSAATQPPARPRLVLAVGGVALLAAGGWWLARSEAACSGADDRIAVVWNLTCTRDGEAPEFRLALCEATRAVIGRCLGLVGVEAPDRM